jgi:hypothetical protein
VPETASAPTDLDLISFLQAIPDARMRRGVRIPARYLLLVAVLGLLSRCQSLRDLERFAIRHHSVLTEALGLQSAAPGGVSVDAGRHAGGDARHHRAAGDGAATAEH